MVEVAWVRSEACRLEMLSRTGLRSAQPAALVEMVVCHPREAWAYGSHINQAKSSSHVLPQHHNVSHADGICQDALNVPASSRSPHAYRYLSVIAVSSLCHSVALDIRPVIAISG
jgi:hypothetical protein